MELITLFGLIVINGLLAMAEMAIVSANPIRLQERAENGHQGAARALALAEQPNHFLSTVQVGITLIGIMAGTLGGATLGSDLAELITNITVLAPYASAIGLTIVVAFTTYLSLVIGELVPKRLALQQPEIIAERIARPMQILSTIVAPIVWLLSASTHTILKVLQADDIKKNTITESEILAMLEQGTNKGWFDPMESRMIEGVFRVDDQRTAEMMTPRNEIIWLDVNADIETQKTIISNNVHSVYPICDGNLDKVLGVMRLKNWLAILLTANTINLHNLIHRPLYVPTHIDGSRLIELFKSSQTHVALVVDEYGGIEGIISLSDILDEIVGDIDDKSYMVQRTDGSWLVDGIMPIDEFTEAFDGFSIPDSEKGDYITLAGFIIARLESVPKTADYFEWQNWKFEVVDMDDTRVDKVLIIRLS